MIGLSEINPKPWLSSYRYLSWWRAHISDLAFLLWCLATKLVWNRQKQARFHNQANPKYIPSSLSRVDESEHELYARQ